MKCFWCIALWFILISAVTIRVQAKTARVKHHENGENIYRQHSEAGQGARKTSEDKVGSSRLIKRELQDPNTSARRQQLEQQYNYMAADRTVQEQQNIRNEAQSKLWDIAHSAAPPGSAWQKDVHNRQRAIEAALESGDMHRTQMAVDDYKQEATKRADLVVQATAANKYLYTALMTGDIDPRTRLEIMSCIDAIEEASERGTSSELAAKMNCAHSFRQ